MNKLLRNPISVWLFFVLFLSLGAQAQTNLIDSQYATQGISIEGLVSSSPENLYNTSTASSTGTTVLMPEAYKDLLSSMYEPSGLCNSNVPFLVVDFSEQPDGTFYLTDDFRNGYCCGITGGGNRCFEVLLILSDQTAAVSISLAGATATGAADWWLTQLPANGGTCAAPSYKIGDQVCISEGGMYALTFCKPGQNTYELVINSYSKPTVPEFEVRQDCSTELGIYGFQEQGISWSGDYLSALDFSTGLSSPTFTWSEGMPLYPDYIEYTVCGNVTAAESCIGFGGQYCETTRVYVYPELEAGIMPEAPLFCEDGHIEIASLVSGGKAPYSYQWINPMGQQAGNGESVIADMAGQWTLIVTDALTGNGCPPYEFPFEVSQVSLSLTSMVEAVSCFGGNDGSIQAAVSGGNAPYQYLWSHDTMLDGPAAYDLAAGQYTLTVIDANGCQAVAVFSVGQPESAPEAIISQLQHESCAGANDGSVGIDVNGGTPPYQLVITDEDGQPVMLDGLKVARSTILAERRSPITGISTLTLETIGSKAILAGEHFSASNLAPGTYLLILTDANGCEDQIGFTIESGAEVIASITADGDLEFCQGGSVTLTASEGASYLWSTGETTQSIIAAVSGTYSVKVFNETGCEGIASLEVIANEIPEVTLQGFDSLCQDAPAFELTGGMPAGGVYSGTGVVNGMFDPAVAGTGTFEITYTYTDENGCSNFATASIIVYLQPEVSLAAFENVCEDVPAFELGGGLPAGGVYSGTGVINGMFDPAVSGNGTFEITYTYTDENGCSNFATTFITVSELPVVTLAPFENVCEHGEAFVLTGGLPEGGVYSGPGVVDGMFYPTLVGAGTYEITYTYSGENGCSNFAVASIFVQTMYAFYDVVDAGCFGESNGAIYLEVHNGNGSYSFLWSNGATTQNLENIPAGVYSVEISDGINCQLFVTGIIVGQSAEIVISGLVTQISGFGATDGSIVTSVTGGNPPYSYAWSNGETTPDLFDLAPGTYVLTVTDADGCQAVAEFVIAEGEILVDLQVTIEVDIATPDPNEVDELRFAIVVTNLNQHIDATGVSVENILPGVFPFIIRLDAGTHGNYNAETGIWTIGTIPAGQYALLVYRTGMLLSEAIPSAVNAAQILPFDQEDPNLDNNYDEVVVTIGESTGGDDGGIESDGNMASQIALRHHKRLVESRHIDMENRVKEMPAFSINEMLVGNISAATMEGTPTTGISYFIPEFGPAQTRAFISTPADLLAITNANEIFAVDYLQENNSRRAAILAIATDPGSVYEHTKVICDRLTGASLEEIRHIQIAGQPFILSKLVHPNGYIDYAVSFIATWRNNGFTIDNRWHNELYNPNGTEEVFNFQVWSVTPQFTRELVEDILNAMSVAGSMNFRNATSTPQIPQVYVQNGQYRNGKLLLNLVNTNGASKITLFGTKAVVENGSRENFQIEVSIPTTPTSSVEVPVGYIFDAGFSIANNKNNTRDVLYYADGPWMFDYDPGNSVVTHFSTEPEMGVLHDRSYNVERNASIKGTVRTYASLFRRLGPGHLPMDMSKYNQIAFTASGVGTVEVMIAKASIHAWNEQYRTVITLDPKAKDYLISLSDLRTAEGVNGFTADDVISVIFNPIGNGNQVSPFEVNVSNLHFTNHLIEANNAGIFYPNYPNPFKSKTSMDFVLTSENQVKIEVLNLYGQTMEILKDEYMQQGAYKVDWTPKALKAGIYLYRITIGDQTYSGKMIYQP